MKYQLAYFAVAVGSGLIFGLLVGLIVWMMRSPRFDHHYSNMINGDDFGLAYNDQGSVDEVNAAHQTNQMLRRDRDSALNDAHEL